MNCYFSSSPDCGCNRSLSPGFLLLLSEFLVPACVHKKYSICSYLSEGNLNMSETENYVEDGQNKMIVKCKFCGSKILDKKSAKYITQEKELPLMQQDNNCKEGEIHSETVKEFYHVENMYTFENIGFTHTVDNYKYLSCADCDAGPVGYYDMNTKESYVALSRIVHS